MWAVQLEGNMVFLGRLRKCLKTEHIRIFTIEDDYYLSSPKFELLKDADEVHAEATSVLQMIVGIASINLNLYPHDKLLINSVAKIGEDNSVLRSHAFSELSISFCVRTPLNSEDNCLNAVEKWLDLASQSESIAKVFRLLALGCNDYVNSYRVYEIISNDLQGNLDCLGVNKSQVRKFNRVSNHPKLSGDLSRHGFMKGEPSNDFMLTFDVGNFVYEMVYKWVHYKICGLR